MTLSPDLIAKDEGGGVYSGVAPQFGGLIALGAAGVAVVQAALDCAEQVHARNYFSASIYPKAMAYYASHLLAQSYPQVATGTGTGTGAAATTLKAGDLSITYGSTAMGGVAASGDDLDSTPWGQHYRRLRRASRKTPRYVSGF